MKNLLLTNNIVLNFQNKIHGGKRIFLSWCILIYVAQLIQFLIKVQGVSLPLQIITLEKLWCIFCWKKLEIFGVFETFKAQVENGTWKAMKSLWTDRAGEYCSNVFKDFCESNGVRRELISAYTPLQNSVLERKNRSILNIVRSLLEKGRMEKTFCPESIK